MSAQPVQNEVLRLGRSRAAVLERGRAILRDEISSLQALCDSMDEKYALGVDMLLDCKGNVVVSGIGKAGIVGQKLSASLSSTGTPSYFLHPSEAVHGDLGSVRSEDLVLLLSYSGDTQEVNRLLPVLATLGCRTMAITSHAQSTLARSVDLAVLVGQHREACFLGLAPSSSTTLMMALGDALALVVSEKRGLTREQFARVHPAGNLGKQLTCVTEIMRPLRECRVASDTLSVREVFVSLSCPGRRTGAIMLTDSTGRLSGIFTDSDLARLLEQSNDGSLDQSIASVMAKNIRTIPSTSLFQDAMRTISEFKISELPVVDEDRCPIGIIDITDVVSSLASMSPSTTDSPSAIATESGPTIFRLRDCARPS